MMLGAWSFPTSANSFNASAEDNKPKVVVDTFEVSNMTCSKDAKIVERNLYRVSGVKKVRITNDIVVVSYKTERTSSRAIKEAIENSGTCSDPNDKQHKAKKK